MCVSGMHDALTRIHAPEDVDGVALMRNEQIGDARRPRHPTRPRLQGLATGRLLELHARWQYALRLRAFSACLSLCARKRAHGCLGESNGKRHAPTAGKGLTGVWESPTSGGTNPRQVNLGQRHDWSVASLKQLRGHRQQRLHVSAGPAAAQQNSQRPLTSTGYAARTGATGQHGWVVATGHPIILPMLVQE